jgi:hypothetical protein
MIILDMKFTENSFQEAIALYSEALKVIPNLPYFPYLRNVWVYIYISIYAYIRQIPMLIGGMLYFTAIEQQRIFVSKNMEQRWMTATSH